MKLFIVRHGITDWNSDGRYQGQQDVPLNEAGLEQARRLSKRMAGETINAVYASDLERARQTAAEIAAFHTLPVTADARLREICFGRWEGRYFDEIAENDAETMSAWRARDNPDFYVPGGETITQVASRVKSFLDDLKKKNPGDTVVIVSHGGAASVLLCLLMGMPPIRYWQFHLYQATLTEISLKAGSVRMNYFNNSCHLIEKNKSEETSRGSGDETL